MKTVGIIGGIGPESTIEYYRLLIASYRKQNPDGGYPSIIINSVDLKKMIELITAGNFAEVTDYLVNAVEKLARAGADFGALAANTPHIVFDEIRARSSLPLISIVEATREAAANLALNSVGLFGTRFTMQGQFYPNVFSRAGIEIVVPEAVEQDYIHEHYMNELINGIFLPETRAGLLRIVDQLKEREGIAGLILGGTELPLILKEPEHNGVAFLDTTRIHVNRIVGELMS
ncbi:MAG: amino acid racemase [Acidobacteriota bacterium]|nr:amino acid racemase [Acidobacteriota bacterium]